MVGITKFFWLLGFLVLEGSFLSWVVVVGGEFQNYQTLDQCKFSRYPDLCVETLKNMGHNYNYPLAKDMDIIPFLINKTISETNIPTLNSFETVLSSSQLGDEDALRARSVSGQLLHMNS